MNQSGGVKVCGLSWKLHLGEDHAGEGPGEEIQLDREDVVQRDEIAPDSVALALRCS